MKAEDGSVKWGIKIFLKLIFQPERIAFRKKMSVFNNGIVGLGLDFKASLNFMSESPDHPTAPHVGAV